MTFIIELAAKENGQMAFYGRDSQGSAYFNKLSALPEMLGWEVTVRNEASSSIRGTVERAPNGGDVHFAEINQALRLFGKTETGLAKAPEGIVTAINAGDLSSGTQIYLRPPKSDASPSISASKSLKLAFARQQHPGANDSELANIVESLDALPALEFNS